MCCLTSAEEHCRVPYDHTVIIAKCFYKNSRKLISSNKINKCLQPLKEMHAAFSLCFFFIDFLSFWVFNKKQTPKNHCTRTWSNLYVHWRCCRRGLLHFAEEYVEQTKSLELLSLIYHLCTESRQQWGRCLNAPVEQRCFPKLGALVPSPYINAVYFLNQHHTVGKKHCRDKTLF